MVKLFDHDAVLLVDRAKRVPQPKELAVFLEQWQKGGDPSGIGQVVAVEEKQNRSGCGAYACIDRGALSGPLPQHGDNSIVIARMTSREPSSLPSSTTTTSVARVWPSAESMAWLRNRSWLRLAMMIEAVSTSPSLNLAAPVPAADDSLR